MTDVTHVIPNDPGSNVVNGEEACEGHGFTKEVCKSTGCCEWNDGQCWSAVGQNPCKGKACTDENQHCPEWAYVGECKKNPNYMLLYCQKSCKICGGGESVIGIEMSTALT